MIWWRNLNEYYELASCEVENQSEMAESEVQVIHAWSAPRSLSTSLMYSFAQVPSQLMIFQCHYLLHGNSELTYSIY